MKSWVLSHKLIAAVLFVVVVVVAILLLWVETSKAPAPPNNTTPPIGQETTIEGDIVCLPHKDTSGPQTLECAYGVKLNNGTYYGLADSDGTYRNISSLPVGKKARLAGTLREEPSNQYQSVGVFTVTKTQTLE